ncbi:hypothetical protein E2C01_012280 [Portunus trituberculatus]|uniref:Uncharacterized protein n=1 Tax=Portunus trituberculatus TaxID=210409 RepID=A0A5B7DDR7_PORTR|nr:hypothetical protein [Portunus trituberculatus]
MDFLDHRTDILLLAPLSNLLKSAQNLPKPQEWGQEAEKAFTAINCWLISCTQFPTHQKFSPLCGHMSIPLGLHCSSGGGAG